MDNLIFCLNATVPIFFLMILGMAFRKMGLITKPLSVGLNSLVFKVAIPVLLFKDMAETDFGAGFDWKFIILCLTATALSIGIAAAMSMILQKGISGPNLYRPLTEAARLCLALLLSRVSMALLKWLRLWYWEAYHCTISPRY